MALLSACLGIEITLDCAGRWKVESECLSPRRAFKVGRSRKWNFPLFFHFSTLAKLPAGRLPQVLAVLARCASRASASLSSTLDVFYRSCASKLDALAALDAPVVVKAANEAGELLGALHNFVIEASKRADEASKRADERADAESKRADAESKRADLVELEFAGY
jgi:hypothetical protein